MTKPGKNPMTFDEYLVPLSTKEQATLQSLRKIIHKIVPDAVEGISYGLQAFLLDGKPFAALAANARYCSYFPMSGTIVAALKKELKNYDTSKGTIRFSTDKPMPATLVRKLVKARLAEMAVPVPGKSISDKKRNHADSAVVAFLKTLKHPLKKEMEVVRKMILGVSSTIEEGIKWNAPSFRTTDYFATVNLRSIDTVQLIFHTGAKVKASATTGMKINDPAGLLKWLAKDRCIVTLGKGRELQANQKAFQTIVSQWIDHLR